MSVFENRVALITGAGSGIGRQLAQRLSAEGAAIAAVDLRPEGLASLAAEMAGKPFGQETADVTDVNSMRQAAARLEAKLGPIDLLIASAGIGKETSALAFRAEDVNAQINVNLIGVVNSVDAVVAGIRQRRRGQLVVMSSLA